jgi:hypothetical protein
MNGARMKGVRDERSKGKIIYSPFRGQGQFSNHTIFVKKFEQSPEV